MADAEFPHSNDSQSWYIEENRPIFQMILKTPHPHLTNLVSSLLLPEHLSNSGEYENPGELSRVTLAMISMTYTLNRPLRSRGDELIYSMYESVFGASGCENRQRC